MRPLYLASDRLRQFFECHNLTPERALGRRGEDLAQRFLQRRGYRVVARNYRTPSGGNEIDIIAWHGEYLAIVEVKTRATDEAGSPDRAVDADKRQRLVRGAMDYARRAKLDWRFVRFDVVAVVNGNPPVLQLYQDAFGGSASVY